MSEAAKMSAVPAKLLKSSPFMKRALSYVLLAVAFFLLGFLPLWVQAQQAVGQFNQTEQQLRLAQIQNTLGTAVFEAQRGEYELALQSVSNFYTALEAELDRGEASAYSASQQTGMLSLFDGRDDLIALLARDDPASKARLSDLYQAYIGQFSGKSAAGNK